MNYPKWLICLRSNYPIWVLSQAVLVPMEPIDVFISVFLGMCIGLAGLSFLFS